MIETCLVKGLGLDPNLRKCKAACYGTFEQKACILQFRGTAVPT